MARLAIWVAALVWPVMGAAQEAPAGDAAAGGTLFAQQCVACHVIRAEGGEVLAGRNARVGPNLWGVIERAPGSHPDFDYSDLMAAYGASGEAWAEADLAAYLQDPTGFLRAATGEAAGRSRMTYQVRSEAQARHLAAYLATFAPAAE